MKEAIAREMVKQAGMINYLRDIDTEEHDFIKYEKSTLLGMHKIATACGLQVSNKMEDGKIIAIVIDGEEYKVE